MALRSVLIVLLAVAVVAGCGESQKQMMKPVDPDKAPKVSVDRFFVNLFRYGNTASTSVPIALDEAITREFIVEGDLVVTAAFGGGLSWGANLIRV